MIIDQVIAASITLTTPILDGARLSPGMQAEVMIVTGSRTPLQYLLQPAWQALNRAFREP